MRLFKLNFTRTGRFNPNCQLCVWDCSFARIPTNLKAIREHGWGPLNQILLSHPDIVNGSKNDTLLATSSKSCPNLPGITNRNIVSNDNSVTTAKPSPQSTSTGEENSEPSTSRISILLMALLAKLCATF